MDFRCYFEIPDRVTYLNTPGNGILPKEHHAWRRAWDNDFFDLRGDLRDQQAANITNVRVNLAQLFHCDVGHLFLVPNFSFGFNVLLDGLHKDLKFVLLEEDYPSLNYPIISRGFEHAILPVTAHVEEDIYQYLVMHSPDVLVLSIVNYINGLKIDLDFIKRLKVEFPQLLIFGDATQFMGTEPFDFLSSGFDAVGGSGYKWMLAGFGNGYMMLSEYLASQLYVSAHQKNRPTEAMWSHKSVLDIYFAPGHQDTLSHGTLNQSILFFNKIGLDNIKIYLDELVTYAYRIFEERDWLLPMICERSHRSALINLQVDQGLYPLLLASGFKCFPRGNGIRIGIHLYNTKDDINRLVEVVERIKDEYKNR